MVESEDSTAPGSGDDVVGGSDRIGALRGAGVEVDARVAARVAVVVGLATVLVVATVLLVVGVRKNAQIDDLRSHGVPVTMTVTACTGLMGGSGSNLDGYDCRGTYIYDGRHYAEDLPGNGLRRVDARVAGVVDADDPALFSTRAAVFSEHTSATVFFAPTALYVAAVGIILTVVFRRRRRADSP